MRLLSRSMAHTLLNNHISIQKFRGCGFSFRGQRIRMTTSPVRDPSGCRAVDANDSDGAVDDL
jgi:hypothetical protein